VDKVKNFSSFQMLSACWVIGKIRVCFAASGVPVSVKRRAANVSRLLKNTLYISV
jgi:hypothetical protein